MARGILGALMGGVVGVLNFGDIKLVAICEMKYRTVGAVPIINFNRVVQMCVQLAAGKSCTLEWEKRVARMVYRMT